MKKIPRTVMAGADRRDDVLVTLAPAETVEIDVKSKVQQLFGRKIYKQVEQILQDNEIDGALVQVKDNGALDFVLAARLEAAIRKAFDEKQ